MRNRPQQPFILNWSPVAFWCGVIFYLSHMPSWAPPNASSGNLLLLPFAHMGEYGVLAILVWHAFENRRWPEAFSLLWKTLLFCTLFALSDEWHQSFVSGRMASWGDVFFDGLGAGVVSLILWRKAEAAQASVPAKRERRLAA